MNERSCLVIGGRGFVGSAMAARAGSLGMRVTSVGRTEYAAAVGKRFDVVIFAAGNARRYLAESDPVADLQANVAAVYKALEDFECDRFVLISSVDVYADPSRIESSREDATLDPSRLSTYGFHKRIAELVTMRRARRWLIVRVGQMVGPGLRKGPVFDALNGEPLRVSPESSYPFLQTSTVATLTFLLLQAGESEKIFNVCARSSASLRDVLPGLPVTAAGAPLETYSIDVSALSARALVPEAIEEVRAFLESRCN